MKLDMHCHVKEGSVDSRVSLDEYITKLKAHGFDGMLITDHDTYKGYRYWKNEMKGRCTKILLYSKASSMILVMQDISSALCRKV